MLFECGMRKEAKGKEHDSLLPKGITGFFPSQSNLPLLDEKLFKQLCYDLASTYQGNVLSVDVSIEGKNFFCAEAMLMQKHCYVLMNAYYPYVTFASSLKDGHITFMDGPIPDWPFSYPLLGKEELLGHDKERITRLDEVEYTQIRYWKPTSIGEIMYNFWD